MAVCSSDLEFHLSRSLKIKSNGVIGLPIYGFLLMFNCNVLDSFSRYSALNFTADASKNICMLIDIKL